VNVEEMHFDVVCLLETRSEAQCDVVDMLFAVDCFDV
jgi:hypothetical protein